MLVTCSAVAWMTPLQGGPQITPPPDTKKGALPSAEPWEAPLQRAVSPFSALFRGRDPDSTRWIGVFYSFQLSPQSTKITLCSPTPIQFPKNPVSLLTIYPGSYCSFCQGEPGQGLQSL